MSGNVFQWCEDQYDEEAYKKLQRNNPISSSGGSFRVMRGGSWSRDSTWVRCTFRGFWDPSSHGLGGRMGGSGMGLRLVRMN
jgi:formylglycine-generating enzyme required for sulfatase activity